MIHQLAYGTHSARMPWIHPFSPIPKEALVDTAAWSAGTVDATQ
jgi:hypothetical protein